MNQKILLIILIIFLLSSEFYYLIANIFKYGLYLIGFAYALKIISPDLLTKLKNILSNIINLDELSIFKYISALIKFIKG